ncbi:hypothetical protein Pst134EB_012117 [Puccinia striiformis f. sp. tritici]|nr:hypothetical protein Pst134EB_012117 [Puccinia striiformis f. sp. tritici]
MVQYTEKSEEEFPAQSKPNRSDTQQIEKNIMSISNRASFRGGDCSSSLVVYWALSLVGSPSFPEGTFLSDFDQTFTNVKEAMMIESSIISNFTTSTEHFGRCVNLVTHTSLGLLTQVGRQALAKGQRKKHAVLLIPGIISGFGVLEEHAPFFRSRIWGTAAMIKAVMTSKEAWMRAMSLDLDTGLDAEGVKIERLKDSMLLLTSFKGIGMLWQKIIENLAVLGYDPLDMSLLSKIEAAPLNLEVRDRYFSRMKMNIEHSKFD